MRAVRALAIAVIGCSPLAAASQTVTLNGQLGSRQALLVIDGTPRAVEVGATVQGVRLLSLGDGRADVEIGGARRSLALGAGPVRAAKDDPTSGGTIVMSANGDGHFIAPGRINGSAVSFMVDTGATVVAIGQADADRLQLNYKNGARGFATTANGRVPVFALTLASVRVGDVEVPNVEAVVMPAAMPHVLLGNSFLTRFTMKREADTMRLERR